MDLNINLKSKKVLVVSLAVLFLIAAVQVHAGTGGDEFKDLYDQLMGWVQGTLGKVVAVSMILVGIIASSPGWHASRLWLLRWVSRQVSVCTMHRP